MTKHKPRFRLLRTTSATSPEDGLSLNLAKCRINTTADLRESGVPFLGTCVGTDNYRERFLAAKIEDMVVKTRRVLKLPKQAAFLLLRECVAPTLLHLLRCLDSTNLSEQWERASAAVREAARTSPVSRTWTRRRA